MRGLGGGVSCKGACVGVWMPGETVASLEEEAGELVVGELP